MQQKPSAGELAAETLAVVERGGYADEAGAWVDVAEALRAAVAGVAVFPPEHAFPDPPEAAAPASVRVWQCTSLRALAALFGPELPAGAHVAVLSFAAGRCPGGAYRSASGQEECLVRASGLLPCLERAPEIYAANRATRSWAYTHYVLFAPAVPFFRGPDDRLLAAAARVGRERPGRQRRRRPCRT